MTENAPEWQQPHRRRRRPALRPLENGLIGGARDPVSEVFIVVGSAGSAGVPPAFRTCFMVLLEELLHGLAVSVGRFRPSISPRNGDIDGRFWCGGALALLDEDVMPPQEPGTCDTPGHSPDPGIQSAPGGPVWLSSS